MGNVEERALEAYPIAMSEYSDSCREYDSNESDRLTFIEGYHQAEKDLELTIADIEKIHTFLYAIKNNKKGIFTFTRLSDEQYQEVLKRFKERKEK